MARRQEEVEASDSAKSVFLANMSHEIRTLMNAIIGMTTIGKAAASIERKNYCFTKIEDASLHLLGVINDIMDMSKIEANKFELAPVRFNFEKMIQRTVDVITFRVDEKKQKLIVHIDNAIPQTLIADDQRLAQIVINLLWNAVKFTPEKGSISLDASLLKEEDNLCTIQVSVTDTGIGISEERQKKLFKTFQQAEADTSRRLGGSGLGLVISRSIVEMMNGKIWVESEPGKGSVFTFTVQAKKDAFINDNSSDENNHDNAQQDITGLYAGRRVLLAEDVEINREIVQTLLEPTQLEIDFAENGKEAVRMFRESPEKYEMVFMDVQMPEMDGYEATKRIRAIEAERNAGANFDKGSMEFPKEAPNSSRTSFTEGETRSDNGDLRKQIPIIAMTANVFKEDIQKCLDAGMNSHIGKPFNLDDVLEKLYVFMKKQV